MGEVMGDV